MAVAGGADALAVVVVMVVLMVMTATGTIRAVLVLVVMLVLMVMVMAVLVLVVVVMAAAGTVRAVVMVMVVLMLMVMMLDLRHQLPGQVPPALHGLQDLLAGQLVPGGGEDGGLLVFLPEEPDRPVQLGGVQVLGAGEDDGAGVLHLVVEELAEVFHIHLGLGGVHHGDEAVQPQLRGVFPHPLHGGDHVGQLAHAGGLDDDTVRGVVRQHLLQGGAEVPHQGAADAAGVHLGDLHPGVPQEAAVNADLAELVFNEDDFFPLEGLVQQLFDEGGLAGPQESGDNVNFGQCCQVLSSFCS